MASMFFLSIWMAEVTYIQYLLTILNNFRMLCTTALENYHAVDQRKSDEEGEKFPSLIVWIFKLGETF